MNDVLVTKNIATFNAFNTEFKYLLPNIEAAMFYIKKNDSIIPFRAYNFITNIKRELTELSVQVLLQDGKKAYMPVDTTDEVYFTTNVLYLSDYANYVTSLTATNINFKYFTPRPRPIIVSEPIQT